MTKRHSLISISILFLFGLLLYSSTLKNPFVWDDGLFIQSGNFIKRAENTWVFFSPKNYFRYTQDFTYRPLPFLVHILNYKICGTNPIGHRLANILLHISVAILLYFLILKLFIPYLPPSTFHLPPYSPTFSLPPSTFAFISAILFLVHPVNTEVVNMVSFVETQLSTLFFLSSFLFYCIDNSRIINQESKSFDLPFPFYLLPAVNTFPLSFLCFFLAVFCKETAITLPAIIILYDFVFTKKFQIKKYIPFFAVAVFYIVIRFFVFRHPTETMIKYPGDSFVTNILVMLKAVPTYLSMIFLPFNLCTEYNIKIPVTFFESSVVFGFLAIIVFITGLVYAYKKSKHIFFWLMFSVITFLPTANIVPMQNIVAERYLYLPMLGICIAMVLLITNYCLLFTALLRRSFTLLPSPFSLLFGIVMFLSVLTIVRNRDWMDETIFYSKIFKQNPTSAGANLNMAAVYKKNGDYKKVLEFTNKAIKLDKNYLDNNFMLASIYQDATDYDKALELYEKMSDEKKYTIHKAPFLNLGIIYKLKRQYPKAIENFNKAIELYPLSSVAYAHLAEIYEVQGDMAKVEENYKKSADINPDDYIPLNALGIIYGQKNEIDKSIWCLKKAIKLKPDSAEIHFNIGYAYFLSYRYGEALKEMETTLKLDSKYENARFVISQITGTKR